MSAPSTGWPVLLYQDEDGAWIAECPAFTGCISQGTSREDALVNIREAIDLCAEVAEEEDTPIPSRFEWEMVAG